MRKITTERIVIQNFDETDDVSFIKLADDYQKSAYSKYDHAWPDTKDGLLDMLRFLSTSDDYLSVKLKSTQELIGYVSLNKENVEGIITYNLGYVFHSDYQGKGYAYEACNRYLKYAEDSLGAKVFLTGTARENQKSCKLLEKLGFTKQKEEKTHFQADQKGNPIIFTGIIYKKVVGNDSA
jgi:RimJ/RimL family protein N-acetyltransferase